MLLRKKIVQLAVADTQVSSEILPVRVPADGSIIEIPICEISRSESDQLLEQLNDLLYCDATELELHEIEQTE